MRSSEDGSDPGKLTYFGPPKDENQQNSSNVLSFVFNFFSLKKDQKSLKEKPERKEGKTTVRPNVLDLEKPKQGTKRRIRAASLPRDPGSEVELRLRSISSMLKDFPKLMKGPQGSENGDLENSDATGDTSPIPSAVELRQYWMPDEQCHECYECGEKFTTFRRRHHCRICGQIFCSRCCNQLISGKIMGHPGMLRSCTYCCKLVLMYAEGNTPKSAVNTVGRSSITPAKDGLAEDSAVDSSLITSDSLLSFGNNISMGGNPQNILHSHSHSNNSLRRNTQPSTTLRYDLPSISDDQGFSRFDAFLPHSSAVSPGRELIGRKPPVYIFDATPDMSTSTILETDVTNDLVKDSSQLHSLWRKINDEKQGMEFRDHRFRLRKYSHCITGQELVDWLLRNDVASTRAQGCAIGQALYEGKWLKPVVDIGGVFQDGYSLFQSGKRHSMVGGSGNRIEIYPDHFANFSDEKESEGLHLLSEQEPIWVQEIKCEDDRDEDRIDDFHEKTSESELTWSDVQPNPNGSLLYSDEDKSISERSIQSLSSFVEIDEGNDVIKYTRSTSNSNLNGQQRNMQSPQPSYDDSCPTSISADYLRNFITWNGTYLSQPWITPSIGWRESDLQSHKLITQDKRAFQWLKEIYLRHDLAFLKQLLHDKGLDLAWAEILVPLAKHAAESITPNPNVCMDVCHYVQIKKVLDGPKTDSHVLNAVVCTKNVVHKQMKTDINEPTILLLAIPLEYQRVQLKLSALDPIVRQEREFYRHLISRITARQPKVVMVQCTVSHIAQDLLLQAGITLVINVKPSVMERVARSTEADIVYSIDQLMQAKLGSCSRFYIKHHELSGPSFNHRSEGQSVQNIKTLMYFDGCNPQYGCTVLLKGNCDDIPTYKQTAIELIQVQEVFRFLVRAMFHARLELSYLIDQHDFGKLLKKNSSTIKNKSKTELGDNNSQKHILVDRNVETSDLPEMSFKNVSIEDCSTPVPNLYPTLVTNDKNSTQGKENIDTISRKSTWVQISSDKNGIEESKSQLKIKNKKVFEEALKLTCLTVSPLIKPQIPFLFTDISLSSAIHSYLPAELFSSHMFENKSTTFKGDGFSTFDMEHRQAIRSRSSTVESLVQDKLWLSPPHQKSSTNSLEYDDMNMSMDTLGNSIASRDTMDDGTSTPTRRERSESHLSCYSQQHKSHRNERSSEASYSTARLQSWEQRMMDQIFGNHIPRNSIPDFPSNFNPKSTSRKPRASSFNKTTAALSVENGVRLNDSKINAVVSPLHEFVTKSLIKPASSTETRDLLASFRAHTGISAISEQKAERKMNGTENEISIRVTKVNEWETDDDEQIKSFPFDSMKSSNSSSKLFPPDCMDANNHQRICALFSSHSPQSPNAPYFCVSPWVVYIDFYRGNDITLGGFLERYCFRPSYHCPNPACRRPMVEHIRSFVHGNMCMSVVLKELSKPFQQSSILTWNWNHITKKSSEIKPMSHDAWSMSFAKYLELNLEKLTIPDNLSSNNQHKSSSKTELYGDDWELKPFTSFQYFMFRDIVAAFKCYPVNINEVVFPPSILNKSLHQIRQISNEYDDDLKTSLDFHSAIEILVEKINEVLETAQNCIETSIKRTVSTSEIPTEESIATRDEFYKILFDSLMDDKIHLMEEITLSKLLLQNSNQSSSSTNKEDNMYSDIGMDCWGEKESHEKSLPDDLINELSTRILHLKCEICDLVQTWNLKLADAYEKDRSSFWTLNKKQKSSGGSPLPQRKNHVNPSEKIMEEDETQHEGPGNNGAPSIIVENGQSKTSNSGNSSAGNSADSITALLPDVEVKDKANNKSSKRLAVTEHKSEKSTSYKRLSRTGSSVRFLVTRLLPGNNLIPSIQMPFPADEHFLLPECLSANVVVRDAEPASIIAYTLSSKSYKELTMQDTDVTMEGNFQETDPIFEIGRTEIPKESISSNQASPQSSVSLSDAISTNNMQQQQSAENFAEFEFKDSTDPSVISMSSSLSNGGISSNSPHVEIQFSDSTTKFYCKVYFASLFEKFRSKVLEGGEEQYLTSMSRSMRWLARGGKSGSTFHKTKDDQFIIKQMSYFELQSFLEFAPKYVEYITNCIDNQEATTISKILGVYRISFRNAETNRSLKQDVLVIENLFYQKKIQQIFDLKGSVRNRHVKPDTSGANVENGCQADHNDIVLLDENLLKLMCDNPLYVHEHTKHLLSSAISRDTNFLSKNLIMDYSLLVGMDDNEKIFVGIIDFIRTFTWDKKLEMVVKSYGMFGGRKQSNRSMPTVVSPELYKKRFCEAMDRYFQVVPDRWYEMHAFK
ncbi:1-phosphatidylinositol 3-phosphate 5-kinase-like [Styela clava]